MAIEGTDWDALEFQGRVGQGDGARTWRMWFEHPRDGAEAEVVLPHGLQHVLVTVHPPPPTRACLTLVVRERGFFQQAGRSIRSLLLVRPEEDDELSLGDERGASEQGKDYRHWVELFDTPSPPALEVLRSRALASALTVSVVGMRPSPEVSAQLPGRVDFCATPQRASGEVLVFTNERMTLVPHALAVLVLSFAVDPAVQVLYAESDLRDHGGWRSRPSFKPVWSPELLRSRNYLDGLVALRRIVLTRGGLAGQAGSARLHAFLLGLHRSVPESAIQRIPSVLSSTSRATAPDAEASRSVLTTFLDQNGIAAEISPGLAPGLHHIRYTLPSPTPRVSVIIPTRNAGAMVERCVRSLRELTRYPDLEILLVDNQSDDATSLDVFTGLEREGLVRLLRHQRAFNFAELNNQAAARCTGSVFCLLNNDVEALHPFWLEEMVGVAIQPGVGAVGAKLVFPDGSIQHGGVIVGIEGAADHAYRGCRGDWSGVDQQLLVRREVSAVTAACLVIRRDLYLEVGGMDEEHFPVAFNDVDLCLKLRARGLRNIWTPHARLLHRESATRGKAVSAEQKARAERELAALQARWHTETFEDPYHSPNLALDSLVPKLAWPPRRRPWSAT